MNGNRVRPGTRVTVFALSVLALCPLLVGFGDSPEARNRKGNKYYREGQYDDALTEYRSAQVLAPDLSELSFNAGDALYRKGVLPDALREFAKASASGDSLLAAGAYYNAGTASLSMGDLETAIDSLVASLRMNPADVDAKHNLELARMLLEEQQQQQQHDDEQEQQQEQQEQQQEQQQQQQQDQEEGQQNEQQQRQEGGEGQEDGQDQRAQPQEPEQGEREPAMSPEDAARLLDAIEEEEKELQAELRAARARKREKVDKDW